MLEIVLGIFEFLDAKFGGFLEGKNEVGGIVRFFVDFACEKVVEVVQEWDCTDQSILGVHRDVLWLDLEEGVGVSEELEHVFADGLAKGVGPAVFV